MLRCMRTTIRIDNELLAEAKAVAARTGRTLTRVIEDALREMLARGKSNRRHQDRVELPTFNGSGLRPGADLDSSAELLELMDRDPH